MMKKYIASCVILTILSCSTGKNITQNTQTKKKSPFLWENATIYFLMTDRFFNGDPSNDFKHPQNAQPAPYRGFMGGDISGITQKIKQGYFDSLGVNAIWMTPLVENIQGSVDEGTGTSYGFHGYWTRDWTAIDKRLGTREQLKEMVKTAHMHGIKVLFDVVINHTGPVTPLDSKWPDDWVKTGPRCSYKGFETTVNCTLVDNLPDTRTESTKEVQLPEFLVQKWKNEGRYDQEVKELDNFFAKTKYPRRPYYYIVKWITDMIEDFGIDGYRVDTAKHTEEEVWQVLYNESIPVFKNYKKLHPEEGQGDTPFFMTGEVWGYNIGSGRIYDFGDRKVDYFNFGFNSLINFDFKSDANKSYEDIFSKYEIQLHGPLKGKTVLNYLSSHDDGSPFDPNRTKSMESATKLLLAPGQVQIYYGDESARPLTVNASGDAKLRSFMNWEDQQKPATSSILNHWKKLGQFRRDHPSIGAGKHTMLNNKPYVFSRTYMDDKVVVGLDLDKKTKIISCAGVFEDGEELRDAYSGKIAKVAKGFVVIDSDASLVLLEKLNRN